LAGFARLSCTFQFENFKSMMENAARANEQKFSAIVMNAPVGILEMDSRGAIVFLNIMGQTLLDLIISPFTENSNFHDLLGRRLDGRGVVGLEAYADVVLRDCCHGFTWVTAQ